jgi:phosphoglycerate kinase
MKFLTLNDFNFNGKKVLVRVDINSPLSEGKKVEDNERILSASRSIKFLSDSGAKVVILAHQGRLGDSEYTDLDQHAVLLSKHIGKPVEYFDNLLDVSDKINGMKNSQILLLKNVRSMKEETEELTPQEHNKGVLVKSLEPNFEYIVNDAFSVCHRAHASVTGFIDIPNIAGLQMEHELNNLNRIENCKRPFIFLFGGAKPDDVYKLLKFGIENGKADLAICAGYLGMLLLSETGVDLGAQKQFFDTKKLALKDAKKFVKKYAQKIVLPVDYAVDDDGKRKEISVDQLPIDKNLMDIGQKSIDKFIKILKSAKTIYIKGPMGWYENKEFSKGTKEVFNAAINSEAFTIAGGGHTISAMEEFGIDISKISYLSLAGGALVAYMSGEKLPGLVALENSYKKFKK